MSMEFIGLKEKSKITKVCTDKNITYVFSSDTELDKFLRGEPSIDYLGMENDGRERKVKKIWSEAQYDPVYIERDTIHSRINRMAGFLGIDIEIEGLPSGSGRYEYRVTSQKNTEEYSEYKISTRWLTGEEEMPTIKRWDDTYRVCDDGRILKVNVKGGYIDVLDHYLERNLGRNYEDYPEYAAIVEKFRNFCELCIESEKENEDAREL